MKQSKKYDVWGIVFLGYALAPLYMLIIIDLYSPIFTVLPALSIIFSSVYFSLAEKERFKELALST